MSERFDLIVIGGGSAARDGANMAAHEHGARVALIEKERWGGSCPNVACTPTKAYVVAAELTHDVNALAPRIGVEAGPATVDMARLYAWKESLKKPQEKWVEDLRDQGFTPYTGEATLVDAHTVRVGDVELEADRILIATGSRTAVPPIEGIDEVGWIDHISALELRELPPSLLVVGAGPVGLEFGQIFSRLGSRVTIVDAADRISPASDAQACATLAASLEEEGIDIAVSVFVKSVRRDGDEIVASIAPRDGSDEYELRATQILLASGRVANLEGLNLEAVGVETSKAGIAVDEHLRTSVAGIWAAGDVNAVAQFTPIAQYQARVAVEDMFGEDAPTADYSVLPTAIFTDPELGGIGMTEKEAAEQGQEIGVVKHPLRFVTRAQYTGAKHGLYKIVFDRKTRRVLGVHVVSRAASDIVGSLAPAMKLGVTVDDLAFMHHVYPSYSEGLKAAAEKALVPNA